MRPGRTWSIALAETLAWASTFYAFPALLPHWEHDLGWDRGLIAVALTESLLVSAVFAPVVGALIDRGNGRAVMSGGCLLGAAALAVLTQIDSVAMFHACWVVIGLAMSASLYEPCFALMTRHHGAAAKRAIITITLAAGFASTLSFPLGHVMVGLGGWRLAIGVYAGILSSTAGLMWWSLPDDRRHPPPATEAPPANDQRGALHRAMASPVFWLLSIAFVAVSTNHGALISHLLPILASRGLGPETAVLASALIGPMQVTGRLAMMAAGDKAPAAAVAVGAAIATTCAAGFLFAAAWIPALVVGFVLLQGAGYGVTSITRPAITAAWLGRRGFGAISGILAIPVTLGYALAPSLSAAVEALADYNAVILTAAGLSLVTLAALLGASRRAHRERHIKSM